MASLMADRLTVNFPDIKVRGANMGPIWGRQDPGGPHVGPTNYAFWVFHNLFMLLNEK